MATRLLWCAVAVAAVTVSITSWSPAGTSGADAHMGLASAAPDPERADSESMIDTWVRFAMPAEHHKLLNKLAGRWDLEVKYRMSADTPVVESQGTCTRKWILGKRFILEEFDGGNLGLPFQGLAIYGYDAFEGKYTSVWIDTTSTGVTTSLGACEGECKLIRFEGRHGDPWSGKKRNTRGFTRLIDDDHHVLELFEPGTDGKEYKVLEISYARSASPLQATQG